jgi:hypothetical protein
VSDVDTVPAVGGDVNPQVAGDGKQRYLFGILVDCDDDHDIGVLTPKVSGRVQTNE